MTQFWEIIKNVIFRAFLAHFALFWANENLSEKSGSVTFLILRISLHAKNQKKLMSQFRENSVTD